MGYSGPILKPGPTGDGSCSENVHLVEWLDPDAKRNKPIAVCFLAKTFDTVSHKHVLAGLKRFGESEHVTRIVKDLCDGASTRFTIPDGTTGEIACPLQHGVGHTLLFGGEGWCTL